MIRQWLYRPGEREREDEERGDGEAVDDALCTDRTRGGPGAQLAFTADEERATNSPVRKGIKTTAAPPMNDALSTVIRGTRCTGGEQPVPAPGAEHVNRAPEARVERRTVTQSTRANAVAVRHERQPALTQEPGEAPGHDQRDREPSASDG